MDRNPDFDFNYLGFPGSYHFPINPAKIKGGCQSGREVVPHDSKSDLTLLYIHFSHISSQNIRAEFFIASFAERS